MCLCVLRRENRKQEVGEAIRRWGRRSGRIARGRGRENRTQEVENKLEVEEKECYKSEWKKEKESQGKKTGKKNTEKRKDKKKS